MANDPPNTLNPQVTTALNHRTLLPLHLQVANILPELTQTAESNKSNTLSQTRHVTLWTKQWENLLDKLSS